MATVDEDVLPLVPDCGGDPIDEGDGAIVGIVGAPFCVLPAVGRTGAPGEDVIRLPLLLVVLVQLAVLWWFWLLFIVLLWLLLARSDMTVRLVFRTASS